MQNVCEQQLMTNCMRAEACVIIIGAVVNTLFFGGIVCMHWCIAMSEQASKYNVSAFMLPVVLLLPQYLLLFGYRGTRGIALSANATFKRCAHAVDDCYHRHYHSFIHAAPSPAHGRFFFFSWSSPPSHKSPSGQLRNKRNCRRIFYRRRVVTTSGVGEMGNICDKTSGRESN